MYHMDNCIHMYQQHDSVFNSVYHIVQQHFKESSPGAAKNQRLIISDVLMSLLFSIFSSKVLLTMIFKYRYCVFVVFRLSKSK